MFEKQKNFQQSESFQQKLKIRWIIEQVNAHLKNFRGLRFSRGTGLLSMKTQALLCLMTHNIIKITTLSEI